MKKEITEEIKYPMNWGYKIFGKDRNKILKVIENVFEGNAKILSKENKTKNYVVLNCEIEVADKNMRDNYFKKLKNNEDVVMVM